MAKRELERLRKRIEKTSKRMLKNYENMYKEDNIDRLNSFRFYSGYENKNNRVVRSITISSKNDEFITEIQKEAKAEGNFIGKDIIINIALYRLKEEKEEKQLTNFNEWIRTYLK